MAVAVPALISAAIGIGGSIAAKAFMGKPKPKAAQPVPQPTRLEARERAERSDILSRRRGTDANRRVTGRGSGEALTGPKRSLLGRG